MDEKFTKRYESFKNSLASLTEARQRDMEDSFVLSGTSAKFSITFDLAWKVMKDILVKNMGITDFAISHAFSSCTADGNTAISINGQITPISRLLNP